MKVSKFGGTSLADASQIRKVCDILLSDPDRKILVVSAPGKRFKTDSKVTDLLISLAKSRIAGFSGEKELSSVILRYEEIAVELSVEDVMVSIKENLTALANADRTTPDKFMDAIKASGEDNCARLVAAYLNSIGHKATYCDPKPAGLVITSDFGRAHVLPESYINLAPLASMKGICVFPGFFGYSPEGDVVTFSRGGSDIT